MARKLSISKSNYFKIGGLFVLPEKESEWKTTYGEDGYQKLFEFIGTNSIALVQRSPDYKKQRWFDRFKQEPNVEALQKVLTSEEKTKIGKGERTLFEMSANVFYELLNDIHEGEDLNSLLSKRPWVEILLKFYGENLYDSNDKYIRSVDPTWYEPTKFFIEDVPELIRGYEEFLKFSKSKKSSERELCDKIESKLDVSNVRDDFRKYNDYFKWMEESVEKTLSPEFRISYLKACADPYL